MSALMNWWILPCSSCSVYMLESCIGMARTCILTYVVLSNVAYTVVCGGYVGGRVSTVGSVYLLKWRPPSNWRLKVGPAGSVSSNL